MCFFLKGVLSEIGFFTFKSHVCLYVWRLTYVEGELMSIKGPYSVFSSFVTMAVFLSRVSELTVGARRSPLGPTDVWEPHSLRRRTVGVRPAVPATRGFHCASAPVSATTPTPPLQGSPGQLALR